ncbi:SCF ubiquitin ligase complex subunit cdc4 [Haplosporangium bisporale]|nr:SCF ubiquitin ligase complex subunit cdc4 [Haplosporangium bisporale]KFH64965.1 F-box and WD-40 domain-containing protein CDC4 [Podila verticillata NRRL 6337]
MHPSRRSHIIQSPPTPPSLPPTSSSSQATTRLMATEAPISEKEQDTHKPSSEASSSTPRHPVSTTFALAPMTTTTVVTTTTTTSTEYPPLFFNPPPIPANLDPKIFPLADTPTPPALKKFCFDLNGQPTFFRENQENEQTMGQLEDALFNLSASAHQKVLKSGHIRWQKTAARPNEQVTVTQVIGPGATTIIRKDRSLAPTTAWHCRAKKRPASPITPVGSVDVAVPGSSSSPSHTSSNIKEGTTSFLDRSSPPHKKSKRPWTNSPLHHDTHDITEPGASSSSSSTSARKMPASVSAPSFAEFATPAAPHRSVSSSESRDLRLSQLTGPIDPASLPSPSLSPTALSQAHPAQTGVEATRRRFQTTPTSFLHPGTEQAQDQDGEEYGEDEVDMSEGEGEGEEEGETQDDMDVERSLQQAGITHTPSLLDLPTLVATFDALPSTLQSYMLFHLLRRSPAPTLQFVSSVILATMKQDFLGLLPVELSRNILRFLDGRSLCKAAQVSKQWRVVVDSDAHIWMNQFQKEGFALEENEEEEAFAQKLGIDGHYGVRPNYHQRKQLAKTRFLKGKGRPGQAIVRRADLPESPLYPNDVTMLGEDEVDNPESGLGHANKAHDWDSDTAEDETEHKEETFMTPDAAPPSPTTSHTGRFNDMDSEDETMELHDPLEESFGPMPPSTGHPFKALFRRHWVIRQNWTKGRAKYIRFPGHSNHVVTCLQFDSEKIISGSDDQCIHVYDTVTGSRLKKLDGHEGGVWALQYRGNTLVSGSTDRTVRVWDIEKGICTHTFRGHTSTVRCLQIVMPVNVNKDPHGVPKYEPEFPVIVTGSRDSTLLVWRLPDPNLNAHISPTDGSWLLHTLVGHSQSVRALAAEGSTLVSGSYDCSVRVWNLCTGALVHRLQGHTQKVYSVVLDTERNQCMSGSMDASVRIWSLEDGSCLHILDGHTSLVGLLGLNANHLVSAAADFTVRIWDPARGVCLRILAAHAAAITCFQHDGNKVISGSDGNLKMWDFKTGKFVRNLLTGLGSVWQVKFDERRCVAAVQRAGPNGGNGATYFEVLDYGVYGIEEPLENAPTLPIDEVSDTNGVPRAGPIPIAGPVAIGGVAEAPGPDAPPGGW